MNSKTLVITSLLLLIASSASAQISIDTDYSSTRTLSTASSTAKKASLTVKITNSADRMETVTVISGVCPPGEEFKYTRLASGCVKDESTVAKSFGSSLPWIECGEGTLSNNACTRYVTVQAGNSTTETFTIEVPSTAEKGVYSAGVYITDSQLGVLKQSHRSISVGEKAVSLQGFFVWFNNLLASVFG